MPSEQYNIYAIDSLNDVTEAQKFLSFIEEYVYDTIIEKYTKGALKETDIKEAIEIIIKCNEIVKNTKGKDILFAEESFSFKKVERVDETFKGFLINVFSGMKGIIKTFAEKNIKNGNEEYTELLETLSNKLYELDDTIKEKRPSTSLPTKDSLQKKHTIKDY